MIRSYPSIYNLGHKAVAEIFNEPVLVQEKVDGSQISFGVYPTDYADGTESTVLRIRSKGAELVREAPDKMFRAGVFAIEAVAHMLVPGWTYRGEYLAKPKHNTLAYDRIPQNHIALFDIERGEQDFLPWDVVAAQAATLGFDAVPVFAASAHVNAQYIRDLLERESFLGGQKIEGVVVKNYRRFDPHTKHVLMAKFVSEAFKEVHGGEWRKDNPTTADVVERMILAYRTPARWAKAVQHLREGGHLEDSPRDIGLLFREVPADVLRECEAEIKDALFKLAWSKISRGITAGLAEWYKDRLLERQFEEKPDLATRLFANDAPYTSAEDAVAHYDPEEDGE